jgi:hypothetical protein
MRLKVLYILGSSRSGTTILDRILGELDGYFSAGELRRLWLRALQNRSCGCGRPIIDCPIWSGVLDEAWGGSSADQRRLEWVLEQQRRSVHLRFTPRLLRAKERRELSEWGAFDATLGLMQHAYQRLQELIGASVIVDSSKRPSDGALLRFMPGIDHCFVHVLRDPRAVAYSQRKPKPSPDKDPSSAIPSLSTTESTVQWLAMNAGASALVRRHGRGRSLVVRYEDFASDPRATIAAITELVGRGDPDAPFRAATTVELGGNHTVSGNPMRFQVGPIKLREDNRWHDGLPRMPRILATSLSLPLMVRYGYPLRSHHT